MSKASLSLFYGSVAGLILFLISFFYQTSSIDTFNTLSLIRFIILMGAIIYVGKEYKNQNNNLFKFKDGMGIGFLVSLYVGIFSGLFYYYYFEYKDNQLFNVLLEAQKEVYFSMGFSEDDLKKGAAEFTPKTMFLSMLFSTILQGLLFSPLLSIFLRSKPNQSNGANNF